MQLHIISRAPSHTIWQAMQQSLNEGDAILLLADATYALIQAPINLNGFTVYALAEDAKLRGVSTNADITLIDYPEFVDLSLKAKHCVSWF